MTKKEQAKRKAIIKRSNAAIDRLNDPKRISRRLDKSKKILDEILSMPHKDIDLLRAYLDGQEMVYEEGINDGKKRYIFVNFDEDGYAIEPC